MIKTGVIRLGRRNDGRLGRFIGHRHRRHHHRRGPGNTRRVAQQRRLVGQ